MKADVVPAVGPHRRWAVARHTVREGTLEEGQSSPGDPTV